MAECTCNDLYNGEYELDPDCSVHGTQAQPLPVANDLPIIQDLVRADLDERLAYGIRKYGQGLQPRNGRSALRDAYEEALDMAVYLRQRIWEDENPPKCRRCLGLGAALATIAGRATVVRCPDCDGKGSAR